MKRVLIAPLDWGLGHATRCIPVIRELLARRCEVFIAGAGASLELLKAEFPSLTFFNITGYEPRYPTSGSMVMAMTTQLSKFMITIRKEHDEIDRIIKEHRIDIVISDNRYGCWTKKKPCVFITHQSNILMPKRFGWLSTLVRRINDNFMRKFSMCWIPDFPDGSLSGSLLAFGKHGKNIPFEFIGSMSRFSPSVEVEKKFNVLAIFSGPEPQRSIFEKIISNQLAGSGLKYFIVRGVLPSGSDGIKNNVADFLTTDELHRRICESEIVISRSGYSTIMDLAALGKKAILIPTPGQTEQEYLAMELKKKKIAFSMTQGEFNLDKALAESKAYSGFTVRDPDTRLFGNALDKLLL